MAKKTKSAATQHVLVFSGHLYVREDGRASELRWGMRLGVSTVEREFLADMVLANGKTMHIAIAETIKKSLETGEAPTLALPEAT